MVRLNAAVVRAAARKSAELDAATTLAVTHAAAAIDRMAEKFDDVSLDPGPEPQPTTDFVVVLGDTASAAMAFMGNAATTIYSSAGRVGPGVALSRPGFRIGGPPDERAPSGSRRPC
jgi:hypothetical protein